MDERRFQAIYEANAGRLVGYARRRGLSADDAEDVVAEVFLIAWRRREQLPAEPTGWLFAAARRVLANAYRARERRGALLDRLSTDHIAEGACTDEQGDAEVLTAVAGLPDGDRELLELLAWDGLTRGQLAEVFGVSTGTVAVRVFRARRRLRSALSDRLQPTPGSDCRSQLKEPGHA